MNNLEWLMEHDRERILRNLTMEEDPCYICPKYDATNPDVCDSGRCTEVMREWLLAEHVDDESCNQVADQPKRKESPVCESDSREKLKSDAYRLMCDTWNKGLVFAKRPYEDIPLDAVMWKFGDMLNLLNRQAAITEREIEKKWSCFSDSADGHIAKLQKQVDELTAERDYWKSEVEWCMHAAYPPSHAPEPPYNPNVMAYPDRHGCTTPSTLVSAVIDGLRDEKAPEYMGLLDEIVKLTEERDGLQDLLRALERELKIARGDLNLTLNNWEQAKGKIRRQTEELAERRRKLDERDQKTVEEIRDDRADYWKSRAEKAEKEREEWRSKCGKLMGLANEMQQVIS